MCWTSVEFEISVCCIVSFLKRIVDEDVFLRDHSFDSADKGISGKPQRKPCLDRKLLQPGFIFPGKIDLNLIVFCKAYSFFDLAAKIFLITGGFHKFQDLFSDL